jgi:hypothetical protein
MVSKFIIEVEFRALEWSDILAFRKRVVLVVAEALKEAVYGDEGIRADESAIGWKIEEDPNIEPDFLLTSTEEGIIFEPLTPPARARTRADQPSPRPVSIEEIFASLFEHRLTVAMDDEGWGRRTASSIDEARAKGILADPEDEDEEEA